MSLLFNPAQRVNPAAPEEPKKWYPVIRSTGMKKERDVAKEIADETTLNPKEAEMAIYQLEKIMLRWLLEGKTVQLGELGTFRITAKCTGVDSEEEVTATQIKKLNLRFQPSVRLKESIAKAHFTPADSLIIKR